MSIASISSNEGILSLSREKPRDSLTQSADRVKLSDKGIQSQLKVVDVLNRFFLRVNRAAGITAVRVSRADRGLFGLASATWLIFLAFFRHHLIPPFYLASSHLVSIPGNMGENRGDIWKRVLKKMRGHGIINRIICAVGGRKRD